MYYVKLCRKNKKDKVLKSFANFDDAVLYEIDLINNRDYSRFELCIEDFWE